MCDLELFPKIWSICLPLGAAAGGLGGQGRQGGLGGGGPVT